MHSASKKAFFGDIVLEVCDQVYEPAEDSFLFAENLHVGAGARVLDMGTGSGLLGIVAAKQGASEVVAVDINPHAVKCAKQNAQRNDAAGKLAFLQGDLFAPLAENVKFDLILFNAPYLPSERGEEESWLWRAWSGGITGRQVVDKFIAQAPRHLERDGEILLMQSNLAGVEETKARFQAAGLNTENLVQRNLPFFETLFLLKAIFTCETSQNQEAVANQGQLQNGA
jgi:release factor glutamine methyltransferase